MSNIFPKIVEYEILKSETRRGLCQNVRAAIDDGFEPLGGAGFADDMFFQTIVRYDRDE